MRMVPLFRLSGGRPRPASVGVRIGGKGALPGNVMGMVDAMRAKDLPLLELSGLLSASAAVLAAFAAVSVPLSAAAWAWPAAALASLTALGAAVAAGLAWQRMRVALGAPQGAEEPGLGGAAGAVLREFARLEERVQVLPERFAAALEATLRGDPEAGGMAVRENGPEPPAWPRIRALLGQLASPTGGDEDGGRRLEGLRAICDRLEQGAEALVALRAKLGEATRESAEDMQSIAAAVEQLSAAVGEIGRNTSLSAEVARRCVGETQQSRSEADRLGEAAGRIASIVETIRKIADQTTLLALNATIEAARAGAAGRSFAVVAGEVKALAQQTASATEDIDRRIAQMKEAVAKVAGSIETVMDTAKEADQAAGAIAAAVEQQNAVIDEIAERLQRASDATRRIDEAVTRSAEEATGAAHLEGVANGLQENARQLAALLEQERAASSARGRAA